MNGATTNMVEQSTTCSHNNLWAVFYSSNLSTHMLSAKHGKCANSRKLPKSVDFCCYLNSYFSSLCYYTPLHRTHSCVKAFYHRNTKGCSLPCPSLCLSDNIFTGKTMWNCSRLDRCSLFKAHCFQCL